MSENVNSQDYIIDKKIMKILIDELVILDDCVVTGTFAWRSDIEIGRAHV